MPRMRFSAWLLIGVLSLSVLGLFTVLNPGGTASAADYSSKHVYVLDNPASINSISTFKCTSDGKLQFARTTAIGGKGIGKGLGSQGSLIYAPEVHRLFAVDAGSNQVSVVAVGADGTLIPQSLTSSGGVLPVSLTFSYGRLYVVNAGDSTTAANVTGFWLRPNGTLAPIVGSTQPLSTANPGPAQIQAAPTGHNLVVTEKSTNMLDVYAIGEHGVLSTPLFTPSTGKTPFGFAFNPKEVHQFIVSDAFGGAENAGALTTYKLYMGSVKPLDGPIADLQSAPCWVVITNNGRYTYTSNTGSNSVSGYAVGEHGKLRLLKSVASTGTGSGPTEMALANNSHFLYVLGGGNATVSAFQVSGDGSLVAIPQGSVKLSQGGGGLAAD